MSHIHTKILIFILIFASTFVEAKNISAYYDAVYTPAKVIKSNLKRSGFKVLATYSPAKKSYLQVIVFTNKSLKKMSSKKIRGFAAIQRILVDTKNNTVRVTNPSYWLHAFLQKDFDSSQASSIKKSLSRALGKLQATKDILDTNELKKYHYAFSMPYYEDMLELKKGSDLLKKINKKKKLFQVKLSNGSTLVGVKMSKNSEKFIESIGEDKALLLPYTILIENGTAYALHAKYYLAISYPLLSLGQFMKISSAPDAIERKLKKVFK
ncbi:MAG TPA: hypothetical protein ENK39_04115 [Epsilonproteobacteria bacterium]|nr:hypothetical protein [Campylobacterota bacterium]